LRRTVAVDHTHLVVAEAVDAVFVKKESGVLNQEIPYLRLGEIKHQAARMAFVRKVERVPLPGCRILAIEEVQALVAELAACVVVDDIEQHGQSMEMRQFHQRLELIHFPA
jgi:hypothetical protein